ncbi:hypothetical protein UlMin_041434 [Ulmus minor]
MASDSPMLLLILFFVVMALLSASSFHAHGFQENGENGGIGRRVLLGFREIPQGSNSTFDCSPSGPCIYCQYSEKNDEKYRCSETGYRIPLKCVEIKDGSKGADGKLSRRSTLETSPKKTKLHLVLHNLKEFASSAKHRRSLSDSLTKENGAQAYITYRSCIPPVDEEKLSVLGFEGVVLCLLLLSASFVYLRKKKNAAPSGFVRVQTNSRF